MLLHEGLTHIQSQIKPWLVFGMSFTLILTYTALWVVSEPKKQPKDEKGAAWKEVKLFLRKGFLFFLGQSTIAVLFLCFLIKKWGEPQFWLHIHSSKCIWVIHRVRWDVFWLASVLFHDNPKHQSGTINLPSAQHYLHGSIDSRVCSQAEVSSRDVVADGSRDYTHGDAELIIAAPGFKQLQYTSVRLWGRLKNLFDVTLTL